MEGDDHARTLRSRCAFVVAMDSAAADATRAAGLAYFAPTAENEVEPTPCTNNNRAGGASINTPKPGTYHKTLIQGKEADRAFCRPICRRGRCTPYGRPSRSSTAFYSPRAMCYGCREMV